MRFIYLLIAVYCLALTGCKKADDTTADNTAAPAATTTSTTTTGTTGDTKTDAAQGDLTGQWSGTAQPGDVKLTYDIKADSLTQTSESAIPGGTQPLKSEMEATYKVDGAKMTVKATKMHLSTEDPKTKGAIDKSNAALTADFLSKQPAQEWTLEWKDKDTLVVTNHGPQGTSTTTLKREGSDAGAGAAPAGAAGGTTTTG